MNLESISNNNLEPLTQLVLQLWPDCSYNEELINCKKILNSDNATCFLARSDEEYVAFIYLSIRSDYVEGTTTAPVAYIEGLFVKPECRKQGIATELIREGERWGRDNGCRQYASDTEIGNQGSVRFHKKTGFKEVNRVVCFLKDL